MISVFNKADKGETSSGRRRSFYLKKVRNASMATAEATSFERK
ncbi:unnamed protein product [Rhodiola kirilowii]